MAASGKSHFTTGARTPDSETDIRTSLPFELVGPDPALRLYDRVQKGVAAVGPWEFHTGFSRDLRTIEKFRTDGL